MTGWDTDSMIWNAKSLQRVVKELERHGSSLRVGPLAFPGIGVGRGDPLVAGDRDRTEGLAVSREEERP